MSQERYLNQLLDRSNIAVVDSEMNSCLSRMVTADDVASCIRSDGSSNSTRKLILVLNNAANDSNRQSIALWPRAYGLRSATRYIEDGQRLRDCVAVAQAEAIP